MYKFENILNTRRAGVLLHITSLPGTLGCGDLGEEAYNFVNFLKHAGVSIWQTLPLSPPHGDGSPYQCLSAHAGNPALINIDWLVNKGWLHSTSPLYSGLSLLEAKRLCLAQALQQFDVLASIEEHEQFAQFCITKAHWLDDYALFIALRIENGHKSWTDWPTAVRNRSKKGLSDAQKRLACTIRQIQFEQYIFFRQWHELKDYAVRHGVLMFGDIPIFVSYDSADVWAQRKCFKLDKEGAMLTVAGVPPDYFSATGQRWGNPHYDWAYLEKHNFDWWLQRIRTQMELFDILRIDHFRGLEAAWEIPANEPTAINGQWVQAPGAKLLQKIKQGLGNIALVAEDLGIINAEVEKLRDDFQLPGMKILQFAFDGHSNNPYLPYNVPKNSVIYTGTHDNNTTFGWFQQLSSERQYQVCQYLAADTQAMPYAMIHTVLASVANIAIIPMQDILELDGNHRMNTPGTIEGNWQWRFNWGQLNEYRAVRFAQLVRMFGRA